MKNSPQQKNSFPEKLKGCFKKLPSLKKHKTRSDLNTPTDYSEIIVENPLLLLGIDLPFIVVSAVNLKSAVALSIEMLFIHLFTMICAWFIASRVKIWQRVFITSTVSTIMMLISRELVLKIIPDIENYAGIYLYLIAVNGFTLIQANFLSPRAKLSSVIKNSALNILAFTVSISVISVIREFFGSGTIWGIPASPFTKMEGIRAPYFGFILVGFLIALLRIISRQITGEYSFKFLPNKSLALTTEDIKDLQPTQISEKKEIQAESEDIPQKLTEQKKEVLEKPVFSVTLSDKEKDESDFETAISIDIDREQEEK